MTALSVGNSASIAAVRDSCRSRSCCTFSNACSEASVLCRAPSAISERTVCRTTRSNAPSRPQIITSVAMRSCVGKRSRSMKFLAGVLLARSDSQIAGYEFVTGAVHGQKVSRVRGIGLQLLPQAEYVIVHGSRGGIVLVAPHFIQKFLAGNHARRRGSEIFQQLEFLRGKTQRRGSARRHHTGKVDANLVESQNVARHARRERIRRLR